MNKDLLLAEAKRRYPVGTKFYPAHISREESGIVPINGEIRVYGEYIGIFEIGTHVYINTSKGWSMVLLYKGKWAEIISSPEQKINFNYLIL